MCIDMKRSSEEQSSVVNVHTLCCYAFSMDVCCKFISLLWLQDGGAEEAAAHMTKDEKIQRMQRTINSYERLLADTQSKMVKLEKRLEEEVEKGKEQRMMVHIPKHIVRKSSTEETMPPDLEEHHQQDLIAAKRDEAAHLGAETAKLQAQIADLQVELKHKTKEVEEKAHEITKKEEELNEMRERLEEQEAKREESQRRFESLERVAKQTPSAKATHDLDVYFDQLIKITEELTDLKAKKEKQEKELDRLKNLVKRAEEIDKANVVAVTQLSQREQEIKQLQRGVQVQQIGVPTEASEGGEATHMVKEDRGKLEPSSQRAESVMSSATEVESLRRTLQEKDQKIQNLETQVRSLQPTLQETTKLSRELKREREKLTQEKKSLVDHSKKQSAVVFDLRQKLETSQVRFCTVACYYLGDDNININVCRSVNMYLNNKLWRLR